MTAAELRAARLALGLTQSQMAEALRLGKDGSRAIRRWESGTHPISGPVSLAVECLLNHKSDNTLAVGE